MPKGVQIAIGAVVCAGLLVWYATTNLGSAGTYQYFATLDEFVASGPERRIGESLRVKGYVTNGSIDRRVDERQVRFAIQNDPPHAGGNAASTVAVHYLSLETPDLFQDGAEVVVEGRVEGHPGGAVLVAENVLAKCPSKFEAVAEEHAASDETNAGASL